MQLQIKFNPDIEVSCDNISCDVSCDSCQVIIVFRDMQLQIKFNPDLEVSCDNISCDSCHVRGLINTCTTY